MRYALFVRAVRRCVQQSYRSLLQRACACVSAGPQHTPYEEQKQGHAVTSSFDDAMLPTLTVAMRFKKGAAMRVQVCFFAVARGVQAYYVGIQRCV